MKHIYMLQWRRQEAEVGGKVEGASPSRVQGQSRVARSIRKAGHT